MIAIELLKRTGSFVPIPLGFIVAICAATSSQAQTTKDYRGDGREDWPRLKQVVAKGEISETKILGHQRGRECDYRDLPANGGILIGFDCIITPFKASQVTVRGVKPIFCTWGDVERGSAHGAQKGKSITSLVAKSGFAVAGVTGQYDGTAMRRLKVTFARIAGFKLDLRNSYESPWVGIYDQKLLTEDSIDTGGSLAVGVSGSAGLGLDGLRLVHVAHK